MKPPSLALVIENGSEPLKVCSVTVASGSDDDPLSKVLDAAVAGGSKPSACVTSYPPSSGTGAITQVNGAPSTPAARWKVGIDGGALATADVARDPRRRHDLPEVRIAGEARPPADLGGRAFGCPLRGRGGPFRPRPERLCCAAKRIGGQGSPV